MRPLSVMRRSASGSLCGRLRPGSRVAARVAEVNQRRVGVPRPERLAEPGPVAHDLVTREIWREREAVAMGVQLDVDALGVQTAQGRCVEVMESPVGEQRVDPDVEPHRHALEQTVASSLVELRLGGEIEAPYGVPVAHVKDLGDAVEEVADLDRLQLAFGAQVLQGDTEHRRLCVAVVGGDVERGGIAVLGEDRCAVARHAGKPVVERDGHRGLIGAARAQALHALTERHDAVALAAQQFHAAPEQVRIDEHAGPHSAFVGHCEGVKAEDSQRTRGQPARDREQAECARAAQDQGFCGHVWTPC
jgi:hypothetical protein